MIGIVLKTIIPEKVSEVRILSPPPAGGSAANLYGIFGEKKKDLSMKGKRNFFINY